ncbi:MAG: hypothetical protein SFX72_10235 [Isosphaeraceae bacterium]|nr:hypothetical protein [Isosphaeraceae bacterium]
MTPPIPSDDGAVNEYNLANSAVRVPRVCFVNGIRVAGIEHAMSASYLSLLIERPVHGIYNKTAGKNAGSLVDLAQCGLDYLQNATARLTSRRHAKQSVTIPTERIPAFLDEVESRSVIWNRATVALLRQVVTHIERDQYIVAHSQGNLITSNALFILEELLGAKSLERIRVYSLASPAPAWPLGLRVTNGGGGRQDNAFTNDLVALLRPHNFAAKLGVDQFRNAGDFRDHSPSAPVSLAPHSMDLIVATHNFLKSIRRDLGLVPELSDEFLNKCSTIARTAFPEEKR